jgi:hypothetical protein
MADHVRLDGMPHQFEEAGVARPRRLQREHRSQLWNRPTGTPTLVHSANGSNVSGR